MLMGLLAFAAIYLLTVAVVVTTHSTLYSLVFKVVPSVLAFLLAVAAVGVWQHWAF